METYSGDYKMRETLSKKTINDLWWHGQFGENKTAQASKWHAVRCLSVGHFLTINSVFSLTTTQWSNMRNTSHKRQTPWTLEIYTYIFHILILTYMSQVKILCTQYIWQNAAMFATYQSNL